jgi:hypothetical protein
MIFLDSFNFTFAKIAEVVTNKLCLSILVKTLLQILLVFDFHRQNVEIFDSFLLVETLITVDDINDLSSKVITYKSMSICGFKSHFKSIKQLVQKFISVMLLSNVYWLTIVV